MDNPASQNNWLQLSAGVYRLLLLAYPQRFRQEYGTHMAQVFMDCCWAALRRSGPAGVLALWGRTLLDFMASLAEQYSQMEVEMNREKFIGMSGWALILGNLAFGVLVFGSAIDESLWNGGTGAVVGGSTMTLLTLGIAGLSARYARRVGALGRGSLLLSTLSGVASMLSMIGMFLVEDGGWWGVWMVCTACLFGFLALFGVDAIRSRPLRRGNPLPLLAGIWFPLMVLVTGVYELVTGRWLEMGDLASAVVWLLILVPMLLLGIVVQTEVRPRPAAI